VDATTAVGIHGLADENEDIRVHVVSREQAYQWVEEGKIDNAAILFISVDPIPINMGSMWRALKICRLLISPALKSMMG
ncbi:hypothetical protein ONJ87_26805, partial [Salmonella enterica subsp. enterica serovar Anatum]|nr:hypothetical protein [Salmonella enterica subsp. enterica serovar Anatum]